MVNLLIEKNYGLTDRFSELAGHPELIVSLFHKLISNMNRYGIELWEYIFQSYPQIVGTTVKNRRIIRVGPSLSLFNVVSLFQG